MASGEAGGRVPGKDGRREPRQADKGAACRVGRGVPGMDRRSTPVKDGRGAPDRDDRGTPCIVGRSVPGKADMLELSTPC